MYNVEQIKVAIEVNRLEAYKNNSKALIVMWQKIAKSEWNGYYNCALATFIIFWHPFILWRKI